MSTLICKVDPSLTDYFEMDQVNLKTLASQLETERSMQKKNEQLTRATLKDSWQRHSAVRGSCVLTSCAFLAPSHRHVLHGLILACWVDDLQLKNIERRLNELEGKA